LFIRGCAAQFGATIRPFDQAGAAKPGDQVTDDSEESQCEFS
jgi:hypothetical protein